MAKPKAPCWLTEAFRDGVDEQHPRWAGGAPVLMHPREACWLAQFDPFRRPCSGRLERFHFINRQRVENALWALLYDGPIQGDAFWEIVLLAAWDARNGGIACEHHHRRLDSHATPSLIVPHAALPDHVIEFAADWGLESELERRYPKREEALAHA